MKRLTLLLLAGTLLFGKTLGFTLEEKYEIRTMEKDFLMLKVKILEETQNLESLRTAINAKYTEGTTKCAAEKKLFDLDTLSCK